MTTLNGSRGTRRPGRVARFPTRFSRLPAIAEANGGNRLAGFPGHDASAAYVKQRLEAAGYEASYHDFTYNYTGPRTAPS
jgi:hypothetical protein